MDLDSEDSAKQNHNDDSDRLNVRKQGHDRLPSVVIDSPDEESDSDQDEQPLEMPTRHSAPPESEPRGEEDYFERRLRSDIRPVDEIAPHVRQRFGHHLHRHNSISDNIGLESRSRSSSASQHLDPLSHSRPVLPDGHESLATIPIYKGSYAKSSTTSLRDLEKTASGSETGSIPARPPMAHTYSQAKIHQILSEGTELRETYGLRELRDGFFDAIFVPTTKIESFVRAVAESGELPHQSKYAQEQAKRPLLSRFKFTVMLALHQVLVTRNGLVLLRAFLGYFIAYILCLIGPVRDWLGRYAFMAPYAAIIHHSGRTVGSQIEVTIQGIVGMVIGLAWGSLALYVSTSTSPSREGYGGLLACSLVLALLVGSYARARFIRLYHICNSFFMGVVILQTADVSPEVSWRKTWNVGFPFLFGLLAALLACILVFPDVGHGEIFDSLELSLAKCKFALRASTDRSDSVHRDAQHEILVQSLNLSASFRERCNEFVLSTVGTKQLLGVRNALQILTARISYIPSPSSLFVSASNVRDKSSVSKLRAILSPVSDLLEQMTQTLDACREASVYLKTGKLTTALEDASASSVKQMVQQSEEQLHRAMIEMEKAYDSVALEDDNALDTQDNHEALSMMLYVFYIVEAAKLLERVCQEYCKIVQKRTWRLSYPIYPLSRALERTTARITHDRGGESAQYYIQAKEDVEKAFEQIYKHKPSPHPDRNRKVEDPRGFRYGLWKFLHGMQKYEARFTLKATITITIVSIPAYLDPTYSWYDRYDVWFSMIVTYLSMHPRVGGNVRDLITRSVFSIMGSLWGAIAYRTRYGDAYVRGLFCALFMIPCMYRYLFTRHPRSGLIGATAFTFVSLTIHGGENIPISALIRYASIQIGIVIAVGISWILWPFVARHEVRKSVSTLISHISQSYQLLTERYLYKDTNDEITETTLSLSAIRDARLGQSIYACRQLTGMTDHEPSLRGTFEKAPYDALLDSCEWIYRTIGSARTSSIHFSVYDADRDEEATRELMSLRRDAVTSVIFHLYILSNALRSKRRVPALLPSALTARKLLFESVAHLAIGPAPVSRADPIAARNRMWHIVHETAFSRAFTDIASELEKMTALCKYILGEEGD
uniref:ARAD1C21824p n=1 Tax=Blastobotrys adeninivorans TaxID=409370 RepID=A0A060T7H2_BLAAD